MKKNNFNKTNGNEYVYRNGKEIMKEFQQNLLKNMGDSEPTRIILKYLCTSNPPPDAVRKAGLEFNKYRLRQKYAAMEEFK